MHPTRRQAALRLASLLSLQGRAFSQDLKDWPAKTIRLISPFTPGGVADVFNRLMAEHLSARLRQTVIVDPKVGASTSLAMAELARAAPDGYSFTITTMSSTVNNRVLFAKLPYDPVKDFERITQVAYAQLILVVPANAPYSDLQGLIRFARSAGRPVTYGTYGIGSGAHVCGVLLAREAKLDLLQVPYKGESLSLLDLKGGQLDFSWTSYSSARPYLVDGSLKMIAITGNQRSHVAPTVGTFREQGLPGFDLALWAAAYLPAGTPKPIVALYQRELAAILREPEVAAKVRSLGWEPLGNSTEEFARNYDTDFPKWRSLMEAAGVKPE